MTALHNQLVVAEQEDIARGVRLLLRHPLLRPPPLPLELPQAPRHLPVPCPGVRPIQSPEPRPAAAAAARCRPLEPVHVRPARRAPRLNWSSCWRSPVPT